jgi:hypothetical protein
VAVMGKVRDALYWGGRNSIVSLGDSQVSATHPSDNIIVHVKTLEWLEAVALGRDRGILIV